MLQIEPCASQQCGSPQTDKCTDIEKQQAGDLESKRLSTDTEEKTIGNPEHMESGVDDALDCQTPKAIDGDLKDTHGIVESAEVVPADNVECMDNMNTDDVKLPSVASTSLSVPAHIAPETDSGYKSGK